MQRQHQKLAGMLNPELKAFDIFDAFWMFWPMPNILVLQFLGRRKKRGLSLSKARECQKSASCALSGADRQVSTRYYLAFYGEQDSLHRWGQWLGP